jgi:hypothetical protein
MISTKEGAEDDPVYGLLMNNIKEKEREGRRMTKKGIKAKREIERNGQKWYRSTLI